jgi:hypothetical protein
MGRPLCGPQVARADALSGELERPLSTALLAAGYPNEVLPLTGITHMASPETVAENLLLLQLDFLRHSVARVTHHDEVSITASPRGLE